MLLGEKMITEADVLKILPDARDVGQRLKLVYKDLTAGEIRTFVSSFNRQFVVPFVEREVADILLRHMGEILLGAMLAKEQFDMELGGERPDSKQFGMVMIRAAFFGYDDWDEIGSITGGTPQNWIHAGTTLLAGTSGNAIAIDENAAHMVIGVGSLHPAPKIESFQFTIDGETRPVNITWYHFGIGAKDTCLHIKEFDKAFPLANDTTILVKTFQRVTGNDIPFLFGVSYIKEPQLRIHDPANVVATAQKVLRTT